MSDTEHGGHGTGRTAPARAGLRRDDPDANLVFDPDSGWFSDVPLIRTTGEGRFSLVRGDLTDAERAAVASQVSHAAAGLMLGVFTNGLGHTATYAPGESVGLNDPRDVASINAGELLEGGTLRGFAAHLRGYADRLERLADDGWALVDLHDDGYVITDAPERIEPEGEEAAMSQAEHGGHGAGRPASTRAGQRRNPTDDLLIFDSDSKWSSEVPLVRATGDAWVFELLRGTLTETETAAVTRELRKGENDWAWGVFTNGLGHTTLYPVGRHFRYDPRDIAGLDTTDLLLHGDTLPELAAHLEAAAARLRQLHTAGWVLLGADREAVTITDAPERAPRRAPLD